MKFWTKLLEKVALSKIDIKLFDYKLGENDILFMILWDKIDLKKCHQINFIIEKGANQKSRGKSTVKKLCIAIINSLCDLFSQVPAMNMLYPSLQLHMSKVKL